MKFYTCTLLVVVLMVVAKENSAADPEFKGCYIKRAEEIFFPYTKVDSKMSIAMCAKFCKEDNKPYAGIQRTQCGCGTEEQLKEIALGKTKESWCSADCMAGGGKCGGRISRIFSVYSTAQEKKRMLNLREVLGDLTDTLEKLDNAYKREMGEAGGFEEEMRDLEDMEAEDMFEDEE